MADLRSTATAVAARAAAVIAGASAGALPGFVASRTFLAPTVNHDLSDINNIFTSLLAILIGIAGAIVGAVAANRYAARRATRAV
ncbi:MAG: hypothetical protein QOG49_859 [Frankiaceae bacterium]|jgi:hypothetical protein|nr:hypothetical protein [Frankiaceae bacterium]